MKGQYRPLERDVLKICRDYLRLTGWMVTRINNGACFAEYKGKQRFITFTDTPGISDLLCIKDGVFLACETKRPGGKLSADQKIFLEDVQRHGGIAIVVDSLDSLKRQLEEHGL